LSVRTRSIRVMPWLATNALVTVGTGVSASGLVFSVG
jgi:hypothetical protein